MKETIIRQLRDVVRAQYERMLDAARETSAGAADPESVAKSKYETQGLEASYLAAGQGEQAEALAEAVSSLAPTAFPPFPQDAEIAPGALVETEADGERSFYLLAPMAGGISCEYEGCEVTILTPEAPLRQKMLGLATGDTLEHPPLRICRVL